ncbi:hypothetical protein M422DRAFT_181661 [Sphaerobolus stellatus SS14]|uniref:Uncharacterized protein n=1 Tax=Sphaerobolus stellatus (strain SS14) TaxID=990650 RepID=A0A0C9UIQ4_SPHS4|nr:hypothetical protein M422DRAFT_181661 [Sphaerobolus stellatus SS14]
MPSHLLPTPDAFPSSLASSTMKIETRRCAKCRSFHPITSFPFRQRGALKNIDRTMNCEKCVNNVKAHRERKRLKCDEDKENRPPLDSQTSQPERLPLCKLSDFLCILETRQNALNIEARYFQLWTECLALYPIPHFSRKSVHHMWSQINCQAWTRHEDQFESAKILLTLYSDFSSRQTYTRTTRFQYP